MYKENLKEVQRRCFKNIYIYWRSKELVWHELPGWGAWLSSPMLFAPSTLAPWPHLKGLLTAVLARTMISTELAEKRICVAFYSLVLHECGFQQYCCVAPAVSSTVKRVAHLSGIATVALAALLQHNFSWGSPFSLQYWVLDKASRFGVQNTEDNNNNKYQVVLVLDKYLSHTESP